MSDTPTTINGELLRLQRESRGWLISDMATRACMSIKQIKQLEEGGSSAFYSESVKFTSAKKVGALLGLTPDQVFGRPAPEPATQPAQDANVDASDAVYASLASQASSAPALESAAQPDALQSQATGSDVSAPEASSVTSMLRAPSVDVAVASEPVRTSTPGSASSDDIAIDQKNKTPLTAIAALFVAALAVAAWMRPEAEPAAVEPPPPLQTLPADAAEGAASAASAEASLTPASAAVGAPTAPAASSATPSVAVPASAASIGNAVPATNAPAAAKAVAPSNPPTTAASASASKPPTTAASAPASKPL